jgi:tRNA-dihydrouridine synthase
MIGRTAPSNPWIFRQIAQYCEAMRNVNASNAQGGADAFVRPVERSSTALDVEGASDQPQPAWPPATPDEGVRGSTCLYDHPSELDRYQMIRTYFQMLIEEELPDAVGKMKQFASWFTHGVPGGAGLRKAIYESKNAPEILTRVEEFFESRIMALSGDHS